MTGIRPIIEHAVAAYIAEHPKQFSERGIEKAQNGLTRKIMAALMRSEGEAEPEPPAPPAELAPLAVDPKSREGRAFANLRMLSGAAPPFRMGDGTISIPVAAQRESVYALADLPKQEAWLFITDHRQTTAWLEFFDAILTGAARKSIRAERNGEIGIVMPWPWPPSVTGKIYAPEEAEAE